MSDNLPERMEYAKALSASDLLPKAYRNHPANVLVAVEYGRAIGLSPMAAIQGIHVVEGKPTASAQLIGALVRTAGHRLRVTGNDTEATATIIRNDDPEFEYTAHWTIARAAKANLTGKGVWKSYTAAMLKARAITEVARDACPEVLAGVAYTAEELGADPAAASRAPRPAASVQSVEVDYQPAAEVWPDNDGEVIDAEVVDDPIMITGPQKTKLATQCGTLGLDREQRLAAASAIIARPITTALDLTMAEASEVIDALDQIAAADNPAELLAALLP
jgi:hypothetical protein